MALTLRLCPMCMVKTSSTIVNRLVWKYSLHGGHRVKQPWQVEKCQRAATTVYLALQKVLESLESHTNWGKKKLGPIILESCKPCSIGTRDTVGGGDPKNHLRSSVHYRVNRD